MHAEPKSTTDPGSSVIDKLHHNTSAASAHGTTSAGGEKSPEYDFETKPPAI